MARKYYAGLDLGQVQDYTALAVVEHVPPAGGRPDPSRPGQGFHVRHLLRFPLNMAYRDMAVGVAEVLERRPLAGDVALVLDMTGVGRGVVDQFCVPRTERVALVSAVTITSGDAWRRDGRNYWVPKKDLVAAVQVLLQDGRLKIAPDLPDAAILTAEMQNFRRKTSETGRDSFGAGTEVGTEWREGQHDDLVLATALAVWFAQNQPSGRSWTF